MKEIHRENFKTLKTEAEGHTSRQRLSCSLIKTINNMKLFALFE